MDIDKFLENINSKDYLNVVLRSHLFIESKLIELINNNLINPGALDLSKISFPIKLQLCASLGLLEVKDLSAYKKLNKIRNDAAHKLDFEIAAQNIEDLISTLNSQQRKIANFEDDDVLEFRFRKTITALYLLLGEKTGDIKILNDKGYNFRGVSMKYTKSDLKLAKEYKQIAEEYNLSLYDMYALVINIENLRRLVATKETK